MEHIFRQWIGMHRAMIAWFHAAHHVTKGTGFGGDHVNIYGEIYNNLDEDLDQIVEKGIGLTGDETLADPVSSLSMAAGLLAQQPASANQDAATIACNAFEVIKYYVKSIESIYSQFEACGMSLGLDDLLQGLANQYETYVYLLQQRSRGTMKENRVNKRQLRKALREAINESRWQNKRNHSQMGYGSGSIIADMSDEIMMIIEHAMELGDKAGATDVPDFEREVKEVATRSIEAGIMEYKQRRRANRAAMQRK